MNTYTGGSDRGLRRVVVRADPRVARVRVQLASGERLDLPPLATRPDVGVSFFATLLPQTAGLVSVTAIGADGQVLQPQDLSRHDEAWQRFRRRHGQCRHGSWCCACRCGPGRNFPGPYRFGSRNRHRRCRNLGIPNGIQVRRRVVDLDHTESVRSVRVGK
jgi:hypothetical protein